MHAADTKRCLTQVCERVAIAFSFVQLLDDNMDEANSLAS